MQPARRSAPEHGPCVTSELSATLRWNKVGVDFAEGGTPECPEKNPRREIDKSQPTYELRTRSGAAEVGGTSVKPTKNSRLLRVILEVQEMTKLCLVLQAS